MLLNIKVKPPSGGFTTFMEITTSRSDFYKSKFLAFPALHDKQVYSYHRYVGSNNRLNHHAT